jgi:broad specificity phosphatase PhoE
MPSNLSSSLRNQGITERTSRSLLVVAHNNTNQALIATALCLPCTHYRRLLQNNAAVSRLLLKPSPWLGASPDVVLEALNQSPSGLFKQDEKVIARVVLVAEGSDDAQRTAVAGVVAGIQVHTLLTAPHSSSQIMAQAIVKAQREANNSPPHSFSLQPLNISPAYPAQLWTEIKDLSLKAGPGSSIGVIADSATLAAILCLSLELGLHRVTSFKISPASITLLEFHNQQASSSHAVVRCVNNTAHLL